MLALFDPVADHPRVRMVSLMDHSPGVGQYADLDFYRALRRRGGLDDADIERRIGELQAQRARLRDPNRRALLDRVAGRSHRAGQPRRPHRGGDRRERRRRHPHQRVPGDAWRRREAAKRAGMQVIAGAPNIVRGGSHSGNVSAADLVRGRRGGCLRLRLRAAEPGRGRVPAARAPASRCRDAVALIADRPAAWPACTIAAASRRACAPIWCACACTRTLPVVRQVWRAGERVA